MYSASRCLVLSNSRRSVTHERTRSSTSKQTRSYHASSQSAKRNYRSCGVFAAASAGTSCAMCHSVRLTSACSTSSVLQYRGMNTTASTNTAATSFTAGSVNNRYSKSPPCFGNGLGRSAPIPSHVGPLVSCAKQLSSKANATSSYGSANVSSSQIGAFHTASRASAPLVVGGRQISAIEQLVSVEEIISSGWASRAGAMVFAAAAAGSLFLNPIDRLRGSGGGGDSGPGGSSGGGGKFEHKFDSPTKEDEDEKAKLSVGVTTAPRPYEVSVRALRGGRLSMEDEFVVAAGGRLSAVFDGHGGGGVSQYLRDHLHLVVAEHLDHQEKNYKSNSMFRSDLKRFMFGKGLQKKVASNEGHESQSIDEEAKNNPDGSSSSPPKAGDLSNIGKLPIPAVATALEHSFEQIDREILSKDEFEYQGSTAVAVVLHEASDGQRTLISANIGDSRGVLSRGGRAVDLTRDHKPNDDKEKARILAMGEKIEWDHYCKVHRVRNLSLSRAVGDRFAKPAVSGEVEILKFPVNERKDEFILLASDGLWDVMSSQEVVSYVHKRLHAAPKDGASISCEEDKKTLKYLRRKNMSRFIANEALRRGSGDNISVVIV